MSKCIYQVRDHGVQGKNLEKEITTIYGNYESVEEAIEKRDALIKIYTSMGEVFSNTDDGSEFVPRVLSDPDENYTHDIQIILKN